MNRPEKSKALILVVDDDSDMNRVICDQLQEAGYDTVSVFSGDKVIEKVRENCPDLITLDIRMPDKNGIDVLEDISRNREIRDIPVVMLTVHTELSKKLESYRAGAMRYISKDKMDEKLIPEIENTLKQVSIANQLRIRGEVPIDIEFA